MTRRDYFRLRRAEPSSNPPKQHIRHPRRPITLAPLMAFFSVALFLLYVFWYARMPLFMKCNDNLQKPILLDRQADMATERRPAHWKQLNTLVMVAGHAIYNGLRWDESSLLNETNWILEPFQRGQVSTYIKHVKKGIELTATDSSALLLFSGGQTRQNAGPRSEGMTYWQIGESLKWAGTNIRNRSLAEEYARDSFENLLFSICRFHQIVGTYPQYIKVVGFEFKRVRFMSMHRKALRFPLSRFRYYGVDPKGINGMRGVIAGERATAMGPFARDPYGCFSKMLRNKRVQRNPYLRFHPYPQGCPEMRGLFKHCGRAFFAGSLPWDPVVRRQSVGQKVHHLKQAQEQLGAVQVKR